jgi:hypothetical protein
MDVHDLIVSPLIAILPLSTHESVASSGSLRDSERRRFSAGSSDFYRTGQSRNTWATRVYFRIQHPFQVLAQVEPIALFAK